MNIESTRIFDCSTNNTFPPFSLDYCNNTDVTCKGIKDGTSTVIACGGNKPYTYLWSTGATTSSISGLDTGIYIVTVHNATHDTSFTEIVHIKEPVKLAITNSTGSNTTLCQGQSTVLSVSGANSYTWSPSLGLSLTTGSSTTAIGIPQLGTIGNITYTVIGTSAACSDTLTFTISISSLSMNVNADSYFICTGYSTNINVIPANSNNQYVWTPSTGLNINNGATVIAAPTADITYTVIGIGSYGCSETVLIPIGMAPPPTLMVTYNPTLCLGNHTLLSASGTSKYSWHPSTGLSATKTAIVAASPTSTITYTLTGNNGSCNDTVLIHLTVYGSVLPDAGSDQFICINNPTLLQGNPGLQNYNWSPALNLSSSTGQSVTANPEMTTSYTLTSIDESNGCIFRDTITINVAKELRANAGPDISICYGTSTILSASGGNVFTWSPSDGLSSTTGQFVTANYSLLANPTVTGGLPQAMRYSLKAISGTCIDDTTINIFINPLPTIISNDLSVCRGSKTILSAIGGSNYSWYPAVGLNSTSGQTVTADCSLLNAQHSLTVTGTNENGCSSSLQVSITLNPLPTIHVSDAITICKGDSDSLSVSGTLNYLWWSGDINRPISNNAFAKVFPLFPTIYSVRGTDVNDCSTIDSISVSIDFPITANAGIDISICQGQTAILNASGGNSYTWSQVDKLSSTTGQSITISPAAMNNLQLSTYNYLLTAKQGACSDTNSIQVTLLPLPYINVGEDLTINFGGSIILNANVDSVNHKLRKEISLTWSPAEGLNSNKGQAVIAKPLISTRYTLTAISENGCLSTDDLLIYVDPYCPELYIPTAFSPNSDKNNDTLFVRSICLQDMVFKIFDRWGVELFETTNINDGWNGTMSTFGASPVESLLPSLGEEVKTGIYIYSITGTQNGKQIQKKGMVSLIR